MTETEITQARQIAERDPLPETWDETLERAREIVRVIGDLPSTVAYDMVMRAPFGIEDKPGQLYRLRPPGSPPWEPTGRI